MEPWANTQNKNVEKMKVIVSDPLIAGMLQTTLSEITKQDPDFDWHWKTIAGLKADLYYAIRDFGFIQTLNWLCEAGEKVAEPMADRLNNFDYSIFDVDETERKPNETLEKMKGKLKISDVAKKYGLKLNGNRTKCPFHDSKNKSSLMLDDKKNKFKCWSCGEKGNVVYFIKLLKEVQN